jgi:hypothetical protein
LVTTCNLLDGLRRDPQLLFGIRDVARGEQRLVVDSLDRNRAAMDAAQEIPALHVRQVAADRLRAHPIAAGQVGDVDRSLTQGQHVDRVLAIVLQSRDRGAFVGGHHSPPSAPCIPDAALIAAIGPPAAICS